MPKKPVVKAEPKLKPVGRNGGMLWAGPAKNVVAGTGRPKSEIRQRLRGSMAERIAILEDIADSGEKDSDRVKAIGMMARYGLGEAGSHDEELIGMLAQAVAEHFEGDERLKGLHKAWTEIIGGHIRGDG